jgi:preprotein translocase subunit SecA
LSFNRLKFEAIAEDVKDCRERKQPVLVGTASIETSEYLSELLKTQNVEHSVLNAKFHQKEAQIIANAGAAVVRILCWAATWMRSWPRRVISMKSNDKK